MPTLNVFDSMNLLKKYSIPCVETIFAKTEKELLKNCGKIGFPLVLKIVSNSISHKTEVGGVKTGISSKKEAIMAFNELKKLEGFEGVLVQKMVKGKELIIGGKIDEQFGPTILFGMGGIFVEIFKDASLRICPISEKDSKKMISEINGYPLLLGKRGEKPINFKQLENILLKANKLLMQENIKELDINPLMANEKNIIAVDARVVVSQRLGTPP